MRVRTGRTSAVRTAAALAAALAVPSVARAQSAVCAPHVPGGVVATEGRGGQGARLIASARGVGLVWVESTRWTGPFSGESGSAVSYYGRVFDGATLAPRAAATNTLLQEAPYAVPMGPVALVRADGALHALDCLCLGGEARFNCALHDLSGGSNGERIRPEGRQTSVCPMGALSATAVGGDVLAAVPFPDVDGIRMHGTAVGALQNVALEGEVQVPAMAAVGADRAVFVRRAGAAIEARLFDARGNTQGRPVILSARGASVGAPFVLSQGAGVLVSFAQRTGRNPWRLQLVRWTPGSAPTRAELNTGTAPAMGPSLAPATGGCTVLSWTEGTGRTTVARAGRVCNGALDAASVAQLSQPGVEAGDSEVASDGTRVFAVWQELPAARGARAELRIARLGCP